jgi:hypothetical protein
MNSRRRPPTAPDPGTWNLDPILMPFDPTKPQENTPLDAAEMREQLQGLKQHTDELPTTMAFQDRVFDLSSGPATEVSPLELTVSDPPTQAEVQAIADKIDEMLFQLKRL